MTKKTKASKERRRAQQELPPLLISDPMERASRPASSQAPEFGGPENSRGSSKKTEPNLSGQGEQEEEEENYQDQDQDQEMTEEQRQNFQESSETRKLKDFAEFIEFKKFMQQMDALGEEADLTGGADPGPSPARAVPSPPPVVSPSSPLGPAVPSESPLRRKRRLTQASYERPSPPGERQMYRPGSRGRIRAEDEVSSQPESPRGQEERTRSPFRTPPTSPLRNLPGSLPPRRGVEPEAPREGEEDARLPTPGSPEPRSLDQKLPGRRSPDRRSLKKRSSGGRSLDENSVHRMSLKTTPEVQTENGDGGQDPDPQPDPNFDPDARDREAEWQRLLVMYQILNLRLKAISESMFYYRFYHRVTYLPQQLVQGLMGLLLVGGSLGLESENLAYILPLVAGIVDIILTAYQPIREFFALAAKLKKMEEYFERFSAILHEMRMQIINRHELRPSQLDLLFESVTEAMKLSLECEKDIPPKIRKKLEAETDELLNLPSHFNLDI